MASAAAGQGIEKVQPLPEQHEALELALKGLHACGRALVMAPRSTFDLRPAARAVERAVAGALDAYDGRRELLAAHGDAIVACDELEQELRRAVQIDPGLEQAIEWAQRSAGWLRKAQASPPAGRLPVPRILAASSGVPSLHLPVRGTLVASFAVAEPLPPPVSAPQPVDASLPPAERLAIVRARAAARQSAAEERRAARAAADARRPLLNARLEEPRPGFVAGTHRASSADETIRRRARHCFEDVAALGMMRVPQLGDEWRTMATLDQRMFCAIDAIVSLGPVALQSLEGFVIDAPAKDPTRGFAIAMTLGSVEGRDAIAAAERSLTFLGTDNPENMLAFGEALAFAPHPDVPAVLRRWLSDEDPGLRALAVECLARRGQLTDEELARALGEGAVQVVTAALVPSALARLQDLPRRAEELIAHSDPDVTRELAWALVLGDVPFALSRMRQWLGTPREELALLPIALAGEQEDVEAIVELTAKRATKARIAAAGFGGSATAIPILIRVLRHGKDDELKLAAAFALQRLTDAPLYDDTLIAPEKIDVPEPDEPEDAAPPAVPLAKRLSDPRDLPAEGSPDRAVLPSIHAERWEQWLAERGEPYPPQQRLRRGKAYTPALSLLELSDYAVVPYERRILHRELVLKSGDHLPLDPRAFVPVQEAQLDAWAAPARRASSQPGSWGRARRRS